MSYIIFIDRFIHPFIIYVLAGTAITYLLARVLTKVPGLKNSKVITILYTVPFIVPIAAYFLFRPFVTLNCILFKKPMGVINSWLCSGAKGIATILTPLFLFVAVFAIFKAGLSILATRRIIKKYGFASENEFPQLFQLVRKLCNKAEISVPQLIVTRDAFARSFTMGRRKPTIIFSEGLLKALDSEELETVIAHELGHIARGDSLLNWLMVFLRDLMFFTPLSFWIFKDLAAEKEKASDDFAIQLTNKPYAFAQAMIKVWRLSPRTLFNNIVFDNFMPHPNLVSSSGVLESRVHRILNKEHDAANRPVLSLIAVSLLVLSSLALVYWLC